MFPTNADHFKTQESELHKQAAHWRLVKSLEHRASWADTLYAAVGRALILIGQNLVERTQAAH